MILVVFPEFSVAKAAAKALRDEKRNQFARLTFFRRSASDQIDHRDQAADQVNHRVFPPVGLVHLPYA